MAEFICGKLADAGRNWQTGILRQTVRVRPFCVNHRLQ
jgi:hypothetical protein